MNLDMNMALDAECAVLGAVLLDNNVLDDIVDKLESRDFIRETNGLIWSAMQYQYRNNRPCDLVTITQVMERYDRTTEIGGVSYLSELANSCPTSANVLSYVEIVQKQSYRKRAYEAGTKIVQMAKDGFDDEESFFSDIERHALGVRPNDHGTMKHISDGRDEYLEYLNTKDDFIYTGFKKFDEWMGGIGRGWLYILAGRPSVGKTAKMLQMARGIANQNVGEVLIWSQEMKRKQLLTRMLSPMTFIGANRVRRKELDRSEKDKLMKAYDELSRLPLHIEDAKNVTIEEVKATARQIKRKYGRIGAIIVDYLTIMKINQQKGETRSQAVGYVTRTAKHIALELDCPFIMLAQLSREGKDEPKLEHLRDSGEIEQDADVVEFLWHNPDVTHKDGKVIQSIIAKGRDVGVNQFEYLFQGWIQRYSEL
ncbi:replicative DNA helicase [Paenibacillus sp. GYB003]|uniref:replicative DNA helicase n=1 Tax=Paenibacillus sp. GYB003 TaxID=2994392 RepID=UPI002F96581D